MRVKNIRGTSEKNCSCGTWLDHWQRFSYQKVPRNCSIIACFERAEVGAHIKKANSDDHRIFIVPLCRGCNKITEEFSIRDDVLLVSANISDTCKNY